MTVSIRNTRRCVLRMPVTIDSLQLLLARPTAAGRTDRASKMDRLGAWVAEPSLGAVYLEGLRFRLISRNDSENRPKICLLPAGVV